MKKFLGILAAATTLAGCAYNVQPQMAVATNIYSSYDTKIPGRYVVIIDRGMNDIHKTVKPSSYFCSAYSYPVDMSNTLAASVLGTLNQVFDQTVEQQEMPSADGLKQLGAVGTVFVRLDDLQPRLRCSSGFFDGSCTASTDIAFGVEVRNPKGTLFATSVESEKSAYGDSGQACGNGASVLARSIRKATQDAMSRLAERLSNAERLRQIAKQ